jgi:hypothetical protein
MARDLIDPRGGEGGLTETRRAKQGGRQQSRWRPFSRFGAPCYARRMPAIEKTCVIGGRTVTAAKFMRSSKAFNESDDAALTVFSRAACYTASATNS